MPYCESVAPTRSTCKKNPYLKYLNAGTNTLAHFNKNAGVHAGKTRVDGAESQNIQPADEERGEVLGEKVAGGGEKEASHGGNGEKLLQGCLLDEASFENVENVIEDTKVHKGGQDQHQHPAQSLSDVDEGLTAEEEDVPFAVYSPRSHCQMQSSCSPSGSSRSVSRASAVSRTDGASSGLSSLLSRRHSRAQKSLALASLGGIDLSVDVVEEGDGDEDEDAAVEMRGHRASPLRMSKRFMKEEEVLGDEWRQKRAAEMVYLEECERNRILPLSSCIQSVLRPCTSSIASSTRVLGKHGQAEGGVRAGEGIQRSKQWEHKEVKEKKEVLVSVRHYGMSSSAITPLIAWLAWRAGPGFDRMSGGERLEALPTAASKACGQTVRLDLSGNALRAHDSEELMARLGICLYLSPATDAGGGSIISELDLSRNDVGEHIHLLFPDLQPALLQTHALTVLILSDVKMSDACSGALRQALRENGSLTHLDVSTNRLGARTGSVLAQALSSPHDSPLTILNVKWNLGCVTQGLCDAIGHPSCSLTSLDLSYNALRETGAVAIAHALRRSEGRGKLRELNISHAHITGVFVCMCIRSCACFARDSMCLRVRVCACVFRACVCLCMCMCG